MKEYRFFFRWVITGILCMLISAGCSLKIGRPFDGNAVSTIESTRTTKDDILNLLGPPRSEGVKDGLPMWTYLFVEKPIFGGEATGMILIIEFSEGSVVESYSYIPY